MTTLCVVVIYNTDVRAPMTGLGDRRDSEFWLVAHPSYLQKLSAAHRAPFRRVLSQERFAPAAMAQRLAPELAGRDPDRIAFLTNDESCELSCAALQERFGRTRWPVARLERFVNKLVSKAALAGSGLRVPRHVPFDPARLAAEGERYRRWLGDRIGYPMIVKPVDRYASVGVRRLDGPAELRDWTGRPATPPVQQGYEVDEYIDGVLYNYDSLIQHGAVIWSVACRNVNPCMQFAAGRTIGVHTLPDDDAIASAVREFGERALAALQPPDGAVHMELFRTGAGELIFLEASARPAGGQLRGVYRRCFGFDVDIAHFLLRAGLPFRLALAPTGLHGGWFVHPRRRGRVTAIDVPDLTSEYHVDLRVKVGDVLRAGSGTLADPAAVEVLLYGADRDAFTRDADVLADAAFYRTED
jgi:hypothetical protein